MKYYIQDSRQYVGNCLLLWREKGAGYTTHIDDAGLFSEEAAQKIHKNRGSDVPIPEDLIRESASLQVDSEDLRKVRMNGQAKSKGGLMSYSKEQIKAAFWKTFHNCGEVFFSYLSTDEENEKATAGEWADFEANLDNISEAENENKN